MINKNDPRLTAYVLNELEASERSLIEKAIQADPELQNEVLLLRQSAGVFESLHKNETYALNSAQREQLFSKAVTNASPIPGWSLWTLGGSLATACLALILYQQKTHERSDYFTVPEPPAQVRPEPPAQVRPEPPAQAQSLPRPTPASKSNFAQPAKSIAAKELFKDVEPAPAENLARGEDSAKNAGAQTRPGELAGR